MSQTKKVVINKCYGGFNLSQKAYAKLVEYGVPVRKYIEQKRGDNGLYLPEPNNDGEVLFDRSLTPRVSGDGPGALIDNQYWDNPDSNSSYWGRYWETWTRDNREHPLVVRVVEELGDDANGDCARLKIVEIPADVEYEVSEYDGMEHIAQTHQTWG